MSLTKCPHFLDIQFFDLQCGQLALKEYVGICMMHIILFLITPNWISLCCPYFLLGAFSKEIQL
jgi:hypothetical protein